jgi:hypothetical protein
MFAQGMPMIGQDDDQRFVKQVKVSEFVDEMPKPLVHQSDLTCVIGTHPLQLPFCHPVAFAVKGRDDVCIVVVWVIVKGDILGRRVLRFVRVKTVNNEQKGLLALKVLKQNYSLPENFRGKPVLFAASVSSVGEILPKHLLNARPFVSLWQIALQFALIAL